MNKLPEYFEPVLIYLDNEQWTHPNIEDILGFSESFNEGLWNQTDVFKLDLVNTDNKYMTVIAVSEDLKQFWDHYTNILDEDLNNKSEVNEKTHDLSMLLSEVLAIALDVILIEDVWSPGGEQFCFTEFGEKVSDFLLRGYKFSHTPDVAVSKDGPTEYSYST
jgi:hypothetical protein